FTATITWGDLGPTSLGTVSYDAGTGTYTVAGTHTYAEEGSYDIKIGRASCRERVSTTVGAVTVSEENLTGSSAATAGGTDCFANRRRHTRSDRDCSTPVCSTAHFTATITWGDLGPTSLGTVSYDAGTGTYTVAGTHTYAEEGSYDI